MNKSVILYLFLSWSFFASAQGLPNSLKCYYNYSNAAHFLEYKKDYKKCLESLYKAIECSKLQSKEVMLMVKVHGILLSKDSVLKWMKYGISEYNLESRHFNLDSNRYKFDFNEDFKTEFCRFNSSTKKIQRMKMIHHLALNDIFFHGQMYNMNFPDLNNDSKFKLSQYYDSVQAIPFVKHMVEALHYPGPEDIGYEGAISFNAIMRHYHTFSRSIFDSALYSGKLSPFEYAKLVDYFFNWDWQEVFKNGGGRAKPLNSYGSNFEKKVDGSFIVGEVDNISLVDERRNQIGLPPLWQAALMRILSCLMLI